MAETRLCSDCRWRRWIRDEGDRSPCGLVWDVPLSEARRQCDGKLWEDAIVHRLREPSPSNQAKDEG